MTRDEFYRQCTLRKGDISWIPEQIAKAGQTVRLREDDGSWEDGWTVGAQPWSVARAGSQTHPQRVGYMRRQL